MKRRVYLDTSVISALHDAMAGLRQEQTLLFWKRRTLFDVFTSEVTQLEIAQTPDAAHRAAMEASVRELRIFGLTDEMRQHAHRYLDAGVFTGRMENDALHVAAAVVSGCEILLSWNFRHLVNVRRRTEVNTVNQAAGLPTIDIIAPPEL